MSLMPRHIHLIANKAFVRRNDFHARRFANDNGLDLRAFITNDLDHDRRAQAANFFVIRQREIQWPSQFAAGARVGTAAIPHAIKLFMSLVPRPTSLSPVSVSTNGSVCQSCPSTGTTSVWPDGTIPPSLAGPKRFKDSPWSLGRSKRDGNLHRVSLRSPLHSPREVSYRCLCRAMRRSRTQVPPCSILDVIESWERASRCSYKPFTHDQK